MYTVSHETIYASIYALPRGELRTDLIKGKGNRSAVGTLVERTSRFLIMVQLEDATAPVVTGGFT